MQASADPLMASTFITHAEASQAWQNDKASSQYNGSGAVADSFRGPQRRVLNLMTGAPSPSDDDLPHKKNGHLLVQSRFYALSRLFFCS